MKLHIWLACGALAGATLLAGCATRVSSTDPINQKVDKLQRQIAQMRKSMSGQGVMDIASNQQQLEQQVSDLQGQLQQLQHKIQQAQTRQQNVDKSFDQRIAALEQGASAAGVSAGTGNQKSSGSQGQPPGTSSGALASTPSDYDAYKAAFNELRDNRSSEAVADFKAFIQKYPNSRYVPNAMYWMGASYYVNGDYNKAIKNFRQVISKYPKSAKASDAYLKMANSQIALKDFKSARQSLQALISKYPGSTAADVAQQRLNAMAVQGN